MSSSLMDTERGGEQTQYEGALTENVPSKKSGGQMGQASTTDSPSNTLSAEQRKAERGEQTAENIRYGQTISEGGMGGMTKGMDGKGDVGGSGEELGEAAGRKVQGYGGDKDVRRDVGA